MKQITAIIRPERLDTVKDALEKINCKGITVTDVKGRGEQLGIEEKYRGKSYRIDLLPKVKIHMITKRVSKSLNIYRYICVCIYRYNLY